MTAETAQSAADGRAVPLFTMDPNGGVLQLREDTLEQVLLTDQLRDSAVIPVIISGAFRRGKSFLLNVLLRYLQSETGNGRDWLAAEDAPLSGFPWRGGRQAHTRDIDLWSRPLPVTLADGQPAHVLLIDTQGAFDDVSTPAESVAVRALASLLSAVHVLNVSRQPQSDDLQQARLCAGYGRMLAAAAGVPSCTPRLVLLVRDWAFPEDQPYGAEGGRNVLASWLAGGELENGGDGVGPELAAEELECFLLPYPGAAVAGGGSQFSGAASQLSEEFADQLRQLAEWLLDTARLPLRRVDGRPLTGASLATLCRSLAAHAAELTPELRASADHLTDMATQRATEAALRTYTARLQAATASEQPLSDADLQTTHQEAESEARHVLRAYPGMEHLSGEGTLHPLTVAIRERWERLKTLNTERQRLRAAKADSHNAALAEAGCTLYEEAMRRALPDDGPSVADDCLERNHTAAVSASLEHFDHGREAAGPAAAQQRGALQIRLEGHLAAQLAKNGALRQREAAAAAKQEAERIQQAVKRAKTQYEQQMSAAGELEEPALREAHQAAAQAAMATAGNSGKAELSGWLGERLLHRLQEAWQRGKQKLEEEQAKAQAELKAAQEAQARRRRGVHVRVGRVKIRFR